MFPSCEQESRAPLAEKQTAMKKEYSWQSFFKSTLNQNSQIFGEQSELILMIPGKIVQFTHKKNRVENHKILKVLKS